MSEKQEEALLEALLEKGLISLERAQEVLLESRSQNRPAAEVLVRSGALTEEVLIAFLARAAKTAPIDVTKFPLRRDLAALVPREILARYRVLPMERIGSSLTVAVMNPFDEEARRQIARATGLRVKFVVTGPQMLARRLAEILPEEAAAPAAPPEPAQAPPAEPEPLPEVPAIERDLEESPLFRQAEPAEAPPRPAAEAREEAGTPAAPVRARVVRKTPQGPPGPAAAVAAELPAEREEILEAAAERLLSPRAEPLPEHLAGMFAPARARRGRGRSGKAKRKRR